MYKFNKKNHDSYNTAHDRSIRRSETLKNSYIDNRWPSTHLYSKHHSARKSVLSNCNADSCSSESYDDKCDNNYRRSDLDNSSHYGIYDGVYENYGEQSNSMRRKSIGYNNAM